jgi:hypothetical protein
MGPGELVHLGGALGQAPRKLTQDVPGTVPELRKRENLVLLAQRSVTRERYENSILTSSLKFVTHSTPRSSRTGLRSAPRSSRTGSRSAPRGGSTQAGTLSSPGKVEADMAGKEAEPRQGRAQTPRRTRSMPTNARWPETPTLAS